MPTLEVHRPVMIEDLVVVASAWVWECRDCSTRRAFPYDDAFAPHKAGWRIDWAGSDGEEVFCPACAVRRASRTSSAQVVQHQPDPKSEQN